MCSLQIRQLGCGLIINRAKVGSVALPPLHVSRTPQHLFFIPGLDLAGLAVFHWITKVLMGFGSFSETFPRLDKQCQNQATKFISPYQRSKPLLACCRLIRLATCRGALKRQRGGKRPRNRSGKPSPNKPTLSPACGFVKDISLAIPLVVQCTKFFNTEKFSIEKNRRFPRSGN